MSLLLALLAEEVSKELELGSHSREQKEEAQESRNVAA
jgi:hypothetical protein